MGQPTGLVEEMTRETMTPHMELMVHKLQTRMTKLIQVMTQMDHQIAKRKSTPNTTHRIQTLRHDRVINKRKHQTQNPQVAAATKSTHCAHCAKNAPTANAHIVIGPKERIRWIHCVAHTTR